MRTSLKLIGGKKIESPISDKTRPTTLMVREALFNILNVDVDYSNWLDLFSGTGSISCEAYNHGAKKIVAVEKDHKSAQLCKKNLFSLKDAQSRENDIYVICKDVFSWIKSNSKGNISEDKNFGNIQFNYIYIDPPYKNNFYEILLQKLFNSKLISRQTIVICEHSKQQRIQENSLWQITDKRSYGQTHLTFLIKVQHT
tara:strand:- start:333 stop:929 length:597 start_codon:yes stop_codon:yes gene_type:complete